MYIILEKRHSERASNQILVQLMNLWVSSPRVNQKTVLGKEQVAEILKEILGALKMWPLKEKYPAFVENCIVLSINS